ncbi:MAG TPA: GGDEF domain-containing protein [Jatrophihabitantaceae bacterium]
MALVLVVYTLATFIAIWSLLRPSVDGVDLFQFFALVLLTIGYYAATQRLGRARWLLGQAEGIPYVTVGATWMLPAALLLPSELLLAVIAVAYLLQWMNAAAQGGSRQRTYRFLYTVAASVLTCFAVRAAVSGAGVSAESPRASTAILAFVIAIPLDLCVNTAIIALAMLLNTGTTRPASLFGSWSENGLELASLVLGAATAASLLYAPWAAVLVLPAVFLLQHQALLQQLIAAATTDVKTELLNATAWRQVAQREVMRVSQRGGSVAILVLDMDHFKHINDEHGHLVGDAALKCVGAALADELRGYDAVGRFGGEEFVALLPGIDASDAGHAAERLRRRIESLAVPLPGGDRTLSVSASIGVALCPDHGDSLDDVLRAADHAMYQAKQAGRNTVRAAPGTAWLRTAAS